MTWKRSRRASTFQLSHFFAEMDSKEDGNVPYVTLVFQLSHFFAEMDRH